MEPWRIIPVAMAGLFATACAGRASSVPRGNTTPEGADTYFYGPLDVSERAVVEESSPPSRQVARTPRKPTGPKRAAAEAKSSGEKQTTPSQEPPPESEKWPKDWLGERRGYDRVQLQVPGIPQAEPQEDDNALLKIALVEEREADGPVLKFTVLDSNDGTTALCEIEGEMTAPAAVAIGAGQPCFSRMLGVPLETQTSPGEATMSDGVVTLRFQVAMQVPTPDGQTVEASLTYLFEG